MPAPLPVDWNFAFTLFCSGMSLKEIAQQINASYVAVRSHASRNHWTDRVEEATEAMQHSATRTLHERGTSWAVRIASVLERHLGTIERMEPDERSLDELEKLIKIIRNLDDCGRRCFGLDTDGASEPNHAWGGSGAAGRVIDVIPLGIPNLLKNSSENQGAGATA